MRSKVAVRIARLELSDYLQSSWLVRRGLGLGVAAAGGLAPAEEREFQEREVWQRVGCTGGETLNIARVKLGTPMSHHARGAAAIAGKI